MTDPKPANIVLDAPDTDRVRTLWSILTWVLNDLDGPDMTGREDIQRGLLHIAWHESRGLKTRIQDDDGPARSVFQMQPTRAIDGLKYAKELGDDSASAFDTLAVIGGTASKRLQDALNALPTGDDATFPVGNLVGALLEGDDAFGSYLTRVWFRSRKERFPERSAYSTVDAWYVAQAEFWYKLWKVTDPNPAKVKTAFVKECAACDNLLPLPAPELTRFLDTISAGVGGCRPAGYQKVPVPPVIVTGQITAFASPDSAWFVLKERLANAKRSVTIGMYDFTAEHVSSALLDLRRRQPPVDVTLMLDLAGGDPRAQKIFDALRAAGCTCVRAPSCRGSLAKAHVFQVAHEKFIVIDEEWVLVQSGNFSPASTPANESDGGNPPVFHAGNRDTGVAIQSVELARFFTAIVTSDIRCELDAETLPTLAASGIGRFSEAELALVTASSFERPPTLFPSRSFTPTTPVTIQPVLTPDNYLDVMVPRLRNAASRIQIEQQYIRAGEPIVATLCDAIAAARKDHPDLRIEIVLAPPFDGAPPAGSSLEADLEVLASRYGLHIGTHVRLLNHRYFMHLHNKLVIIDDSTVLVSSQNWSDPAVTTNREAGLLIDSPDLARYFNQVVDLDWSTGVQSLAELPLLNVNPPAIAVAGVGAVLPVALTPGDYEGV